MQQLPTSSLHRLAPYLVPVVVFATAILISLLILRDLSGNRAAVVAAALAVDLLISVPLLVYFVLVRTGRLPAIIVIPAFIVGCIVSINIIPSQHETLHTFLHWAVLPVELTVFIYIIVQARRLIKSVRGGSGDFVDSVRAILRRTLGSRVPADILTTEISLVYYALRRQPTETRQGTKAYSVYREVGYGSVAVALVMILIVETPVVHLLVAQWSTVAAWILTALSIYSMIWLIGDYRAMKMRSILIGQTHLFVRVGLRWQADILFDNISSIEVISPATEANKGAADVGLLQQRNLRVILHKPVELTGLYGLRRQTNEILLQVDDAASMRKSVIAAIPKHA